MAKLQWGPGAASAVLQLFISTVSPVHISHISAPSVVLGGDELILDCDFSYQESESSQLDLKWYFNSSPFPIYQWVPSMKKGPQVIGDLFKNNLDLLYSAHNDTFKKHRALHILNPDHRFSGTYMCKVSSFVDEDFQQKEVLVIDPPQKVSIFSKTSPGNTSLSTVTCSVEEIYPANTVKLFWTDSSTKTPAESTVTITSSPVRGLEDVTVTAPVPGDWVERAVCQVTILNTHFRLTEELVLKAGTGLPSPLRSSARSSSFQAVILVLLIVSQ